METSKGDTNVTLDIYRWSKVILNTKVEENILKTKVEDNIPKIKVEENILKADIE